ncbi:TPA: hypothetical protein ACF637_002091 [Salmonella enterica]
MGINIIELAKLGHERAAELKSSCSAVDVRSLAQLISDLATQLEVQFVRSTNMAVQLANAESKCRELAAECESKKNALAAILEHCPVNDPDIDKAVAAMIAYDNLYCEKTPATDAFLAEVRACAIETFADNQAKIADEELVGGNLDLSLRFRGMARAAKEFAAQIRKGGAA